MPSRAPASAASDHPQQQRTTAASVLDATAYPHIHDRILLYAGREGLLALRGANRAWRAQADALLAKHIVLCNAESQPRLTPLVHHKGESHYPRKWRVNVRGPHGQRLPQFMAWDEGYSPSLPAAVRDHTVAPGSRPLGLDEWYALPDKSSAAAKPSKLFSVFKSTKTKGDAAKELDTRQAARRAAAVVQCFSSLPGSVPHVVDIVGPVPRARRLELLGAISGPFILRSHQYMRQSPEIYIKSRQVHGDVRHFYQSGFGAELREVLLDTQNRLPVTTLVSFEGCRRRDDADSVKTYSCQDLKVHNLPRTAKYVRNLVSEHGVHYGQLGMDHGAMRSWGPDLREIVYVFHQPTQLGGSCVPTSRLLEADFHLLAPLFNAGSVLLSQARITLVGLTNMHACDYFTAPLQPYASVSEAEISAQLAEYTHSVLNPPVDRPGDTRRCAGVPLARYVAATLEAFRYMMKESPPPDELWPDRPKSARKGSVEVMRWWNDHQDVADKLLANIRFLSMDEYKADVGETMFEIETNEEYE